MKKTILILSAWLLGPGWGALSPARPLTRKYKYSLDPTRAEQTLAAIPLGEPLYGEAWLKILGAHRGDTYAVRKGDNLWNISKRTLGDPRLWRKLWQVNAALTNPHELEIGQILAYYRDEPSRHPAGIPVVKLMPNANGASADLDQDSIINIDVKNRFVPSILVINREEVKGEVTGAYTERRGLIVFDDAYVKMTTADSLKAGESFSIVRLEKKISEGLVVSVVGQLKLLESGEKFWKAEVVQHAGVIERGDFVITLQKPVSLDSYYLPPAELTARVMMGEMDDTKVFGQGQLVLLNKGSADGMKSGFLFRVRRDTDPDHDSSSGVDPASKGDIQVVYTGQMSSIGYIVKNYDPILIGDSLVPAQTFSDPASDTVRSLKPIELE